MINDVERFLQSDGHGKHVNKKSKSVNALKRPLRSNLPSSEFEETDIS